MEPYSMKNPFPATVRTVRHITKPGSAKETIHVDFSLEGSGLEYTTGDALGVFPGMMNNSWMLSSTLWSCDQTK